MCKFLHVPGWPGCLPTGKWFMVASCHSMFERRAAHLARVAARVRPLWQGPPDPQASCRSHAVHPVERERGCHMGHRADDLRSRVCILPRLQSTCGPWLGVSDVVFSCQISSCVRICFCSRSFGGALLPRLLLSLRAPRYLQHSIDGDEIEAFLLLIRILILRLTHSWVISQLVCRNSSQELCKLSICPAVSWLVAQAKAAGASPQGLGGRQTNSCCLSAPCSVSMR